MMETVRKLAASETRDELHVHAALMLDRYGAEAENEALACHNTLMERGDEASAAAVLELLTAMWEVGDRGAR